MEGPSAYKVSTITAVATVSTCIDLDLFFEHVAIGSEDAIVFVGKGSVDNVQTRGIRPLKPKKCRYPQRFFDHQVTVVYRSNVLTNQGNLHVEAPNIKVFHNGNLQLTGVKSLEGGRQAVQYIADALTLIASFCPMVLPLGLSNAPPIAANFRACLINSDFNAGYVLRRDHLYTLMSGPIYSVRCVFETYYPGVKVQFMWNAAREQKQSGVCSCIPSCSGKGDGKQGGCRKITMSVFQSGCCIITGAHTYAQLDDAHSFLCGVFLRHRGELTRPSEPFALKTIDG